MLTQSRGLTFDVAITSYRRPKLVKAAVLSCLVQGPLLTKIIVVDDASGDDTGDVIRSVKDPRIVFAERAENGGIAAARRDAFALSNADWTVSLDSDHELLPGALGGLARLLASAEESVDILGARYRWDTGAVTPRNVPNHTIGYEERVRLSAQRNNIGSDYLCAVSRRVRAAVKWEPLRTGFPDTLFQLDIAKVGNATFTPEILALEKSTGEHSWTRGTARQRWARRCQDASDGIKALRLLLIRHETGLRRWGRPLLAGLYRQGAFYAMLCNQRAQAWQWLGKSAMLAPLSGHSLVLGVACLLPRQTLKGIYLLRR